MGTNWRFWQFFDLIIHHIFETVEDWPSRHLGFDRIANSAIRPPTPKTLGLKQTWSGLDASFKLYCGLETGVRGHSRSSKAALLDRTHTTLYSSSIVTMPLSITVSEPHIGRKSLSLCVRRPSWG